jgi:hypothetical protein
LAVDFSHNNIAAYKKLGDSMRVVEARSRARPIDRCHACATCERAYDTKGRYEPNAMVEVVGHNN